MAVLKIKDSNGEFIDIPSIVGPQGPQGIQGPQGEQGIPGTTDYNELENKPTIPDVNNMGSIVVDDISCKNLMNTDKMFGEFKTSDNLYTFTVTNFYYNSYACTLAESGLSVDTDYILSMNVLTNTNNLSCQISITAYNGTTVLYEKSSTVTTGNVTREFRLPANTNKVEFRVNRYNTPTTNTITVSNMQIEKGTVVSEYTPYKSLGYTSGSNANGSWVKYDDGTLICKGRFEIAANTAALTLTMPHAFIAGSSADIVATNRYTMSKTIIMSAIMTSATTAAIHPIDVKTGDVPTHETSGGFIAIGRWK